MKFVRDIPFSVQHILPPFLCYYLTAILVLRPNTRISRLALLPLTLFSVVHTALRVDLSQNNERLVYLNQGFVLGMTTIGVRAIIWSFQPLPYRRLNPSSLFVDALDLTFNLRGLGWDWSSGLKLPTDYRNTSNPPLFLLFTLSSFLGHLFLFDLVLYAVQSLLGHKTMSIFDPALPPLLRYLRSSFITLLSGFVVYLAILLVYLLTSFLLIALLFQHPTSWPPLFDKPWLSTSLNQFWSTRWHQLFRHIFIAFAGRPLFHLTRGSRLAAVLGVFFISGVFHYIGLWGMGRGSDFPFVVGFFFVMGVGTLLEYAFKMITGHRVSGFLGWLWCFAWIISWGNLFIDASLSRGLAASKFYPDDWRPAIWIFARFDSFFFSEK